MSRKNESIRIDFKEVSGDLMGAYGNRKRMLVIKNERGNGLRHNNKSIDLDEDLIKFSSIFEVGSVAKVERKYG